MSCCLAPTNTPQLRVLDVCVIRAASLDFSCDSLEGEEDAILSSCDSFRSGGQIEPTGTACAELNACDSLPVGLIPAGR